MPDPNSLALVMGIDPGPTRPASLAAWIVLSLDVGSGTVGVLRQAVHLSKALLAEVLDDQPLLADPRLQLVAMTAPLTPLPLERKPWRARSIEIRLSRGAFSGAARGPWMPWLSNQRTWPRYQRAALLQALLQSRGFPLLGMPAHAPMAELPSRGLVEVYPKATLALLSSTSALQLRPPAGKFLGELDDWLFPRLFTNEESSPPPIQASLQAMGCVLRLEPEALGEARRISGLRRPFPRREPMRAFVAALQGILALHGHACLVGAPGDHEGSILLPATWHPDWEVEWRDDRREVPQLRRVPLRALFPDREPFPFHVVVEPPVATLATCALAGDSSPKGHP